MYITNFKMCSGHSRTSKLPLNFYLRNFSDKIVKRKVKSTGWWCNAQGHCNKLLLINLLFREGKAEAKTNSETDSIQNVWKVLELFKKLTLIEKPSRLRRDGFLYSFLSAEGTLFKIGYSSLGQGMSEKKYPPLGGVVWLRFYDNLLYQICYRYILLNYSLTAGNLKEQWLIFYSDIIYHVTAVWPF